MLGNCLFIHAAGPGSGKLRRRYGHWKVRNLRPPIESSDIEVTAAALRSIQVYAPKSRRTEYEKAVQSAAQWMEAVQPRDTEDRAFRIVGLHWAGGKRDAIIKKAATDLMVSQRPDGGWAQLPTLASDAYATGQALTALHESDVVPISHPAYQRGIQFLLNTQLADGSWYVRTRTFALAVTPPEGNTPAPVVAVGHFVQVAKERLIGRS